MLDQYLYNKILTKNNNENWIRHIAPYTSTGNILSIQFTEKGTGEINIVFIVMEI